MRDLKYAPLISPQNLTTLWIQQGEKKIMVILSLTMDPVKCIAE